MRKIEEEMLRAIRYRKDWKQGNTSVHATDTHVAVYLHGNLIARHYYFEYLELFDGGWSTVTTKSRLNAICDEFNLTRIYQKNHVWLQDGKVWLSGVRYVTNR